MDIIICGAGTVGKNVAQQYDTQGHNVTVIDMDQDKLNALEQTLDIRTLLGSGTDALMLQEAGCQNADLFIGATNIDEINLLACNFAKQIGVTKTIARVHQGRYFEGRGLNYARHLDIDLLVCPEYSTALAIAQTLRNPGALAVERFARGMIEMQQLAISEKAKAVGQQLINLKLPGNTKLASIERAGVSFIPDGNTVIHSNDVVTLIGETIGFEKALKQLQTDASSHKKIMIIGDTPLSFWLCKALRSRAFSVRLYVPNNPQRAEELANQLDWVTVLNVDTSDPNAFVDERVNAADAFVAVTDDEEHNILVAANAKSLGSKQSIAVLHQETYQHLIHNVGVDKSFSPRNTAFNQIKNLLDDRPVKKMADLAVGIADVYEVRVTPQSKSIIGIALKDIKFPEKTLIAAIQRGLKVRVPTAMDTIEEGDTLVVICPSDSEKQLKKLINI